MANTKHSQRTWKKIKLPENMQYVSINIIHIPTSKKPMFVCTESEKWRCSSALFTIEYYIFFDYIHLFMAACTNDDEKKKQ